MSVKTESPCIGICLIIDNGVEEFCEGRGRTAREIERWTTYTDADKIEINEISLNRLHND